MFCLHKYQFITVNYYEKATQVVLICSKCGKVKINTYWAALNPDAINSLIAAKGWEI